MRKNWVLVVGAIRNEFYVRTLFLKIHEMRIRGVVTGIVLSTWKGELDKFEGLRESLEKLGIIVVETTYINESIEREYNVLSYSRQRVSISAGIKVIPNDCYIIKLRTDLMAGLKCVLDVAENNSDLLVKRFGEFPCVYNRKIGLSIHGFHWFVFPYDMFFYGLKPDIEKMMTPIQYKSNTGFVMLTDHTLIFGFCFNFYPFLKEILNITSLKLFSEVTKYCNRKEREDLSLPRLIVRAWGIMCAFLYTQVYIVNGVMTNKNKVRLNEFFAGKIKSNEMIRKLVLGEVEESKLTSIWKDEMLKIAMDLPSTHGYTFDEYLELKNFVVDKLNRRDLIADYPFIEPSVSNISKPEAGIILLKKYGDTKLIDDILTGIDNNFNSFNAIYRRIFDNQCESSKALLLEAACFDANWDVDVFSKYLKYLSEHKAFFNPETLKVVLRYLNMQIETSLRKSEITAVFYLLKSYGSIVDTNDEIRDFYDSIQRITFTLLNKLIGGIKIGEVDDENEYVRQLVYVLNTKQRVNENLMIVDALIEIRPDNNPFSPHVLSKITDVEKKLLIFKIYKERPYSGCCWGIDDSPEDLIESGNIETFLSKCSDIKDEKEIKNHLSLAFSVFWQYPSLQQKISSTIESLGDKLSEPDFIVKINKFIQTGTMSVLRDDMLDRNNFLLLVESLYHKNCLLKNGQTISEMCFGDRERQVIYQTYVRLETDERLDFFSMKVGCEMWLHYIPYITHEGSKVFEVSVWENGQNWPGADRKNKSAFAAYIRLLGSDVFISIEMSAKDTVRARKLAQSVGYEEKNSPGNIIRFVTKRFPFKDENDLSRAVNEALDEFCKVGEKVVAALDGFQHEKAPAM